jgi:cyclic pyranopterin phosphate synthase
MPKEVFGRDYAFLPRPSVLTFEEIEQARAGVRRARRREAPDHGGEPLVRRDLPVLVAMLAAIRGRTARRST